MFYVRISGHVPSAGDSHELGHLWVLSESGMSPSRGFVGGSPFFYKAGAGGAYSSSDIFSSSGSGSGWP
jgi:hypothetical protein